MLRTIRESGGIAPSVLSICTIWRRAISFTPLAALAPRKEIRFSLSRSRSGRLEEEKNPLLMEIIETRFLSRPVRIPVSIRAELSRIFMFYINISNQNPCVYNDNHIQRYTRIRSAAQRGDTVPRIPHFSKITLCLHCIKRR